MRSLFLVMGVLIFSTQGFAFNQLVAAEYYVNNDPGKGFGTSIPNAADGSFDGNIESIDIDISASNFSEGTHTLYVRFKDVDGKWGVSKGMQFTVKEEEEFIYQLSAAEYFVDDDPGEGLGTAISGTFNSSLETLNFDVSATGLTEGQHKVYVRFKDANDQWGSPRGQVFNVSEQADFTYSLAKAEYFIGDDPGQGNGTPITVTTNGAFDEAEETIEMEVPLSNLPDGNHMIFTRFQDNKGSWGAERGFQFRVQSTEEEDLTIVAAEYFVNEDPGVGNGTPIAAPADGAFDEAVEELEATFTITDLSLGQHYVYFRVKGSNGRWGPARGVPFRVENITIIDRAEYFFNSDPGEGSGTAIPAPVDGSFNSTEENIDLNIDVSSTGLAIGQHTMYLRFRNSKGEWSQPASKNFTIQTKPQIWVSADTLQFGEHVVGDSTSLSFTVKNEGDAALQISNIVSSSTEFTVDETTGSIPADSNDELTFTVQYKPSSAGSKNATLTIQNNDQNQTIRLIGSALPREAIMQISVSQLDYGNVLVGDSVSKQIAVYNSGYGELNITSITVNSSEFSVSPTTGSLPAQSSLTDSLVINVALVPETDGDKTATLSIAGNVATQTVSLSGEAEFSPEPTISLSTDSLAFSAVEIGKDSVRTLQIRNLGTNTLTISSFNISGTGFSGELSTPRDVEMGTPVNVPVTFAPETATGFSGSIVIQSNDASKGTVEVKLSGEGTVGPPTRILAINPENLEFGHVTRNDTAKQVLTLLNEGNATMEITVMASDDSNFFVENGPTPSNPIHISPSSTRDVEISFSPATGDGQEFNGQLSIGSNRTDGSGPVTVSLKGTGVNQPTPNIQLSTRTLDFGQLRLQNSETLTFKMTNGGNADLSVNSVTISDNAFVLTSPSTTAFTLQPKQEQSFTVEFTPNQVRNYSGALTVNSNIDPVQLELKGEGVTLSAGVDSVTMRTEEVKITKGVSVPISIQPTGLGNNGSANLYYKAGGGGAASSYTKAEMVANSAGVFSTSIPSNVTSDNGISYWFEVSDGIETVTSPQSNPNLNPYSIMVEVPEGVMKNSPQPAGSDQNFYRLISVPLTEISGAVDTVLQNFGTADEDKWRLFRWQTGKYVEHSESGFESFAPGRGYFFITTTAASIQSGSGTSARTDGLFSIFLQPGWNMIGSPFTYPTSWNNAEVPSGVENLWAYDGSGFTNSPNLIPWEGYFVNNTTNNPVELKLSPIEVSGSSKGQNTLPFDETEGWAIQLQASAGIVKDHYNFMGVHPMAKNTKDSLDLFDAPKQPGEFLQLGFKDDHEVSSKRLSVDMREPGMQGNYWDFEIQTNTKAPEINIEWLLHGELPTGYLIKLIDKNQKTLLDVDFDENSSRTIRSAMGAEFTREFRLIVGTEAFISSNNMGIADLPESFILKHNYPNPFNPSTTIVYGLPEAADVTIEIYNTIGRKVATLVDERKEAGYYDLLWDASSVASGVYFYRIKARGNISKSTFTKIHKMMLIK